MADMDALLNADPLARIEVLSKDLPIGQMIDLSIEFTTIEETSFGLQWRVIATGRAGLPVEHDMILEKLE